MTEYIERIHTFMTPLFDQVKRPAKGALKHDFLVPGGPYEEQWDWDGFFIGLALIKKEASQARFLKNWALNYIENAEPQGKVAGCLTPEGWDPRLFQMKPFLAQGIFIAANELNDFSWIPSIWEKAKLIICYRETYFWKPEYGLAVWHNSMESGADNNVALLDFPNQSVLAVDLNSFIYKEYLSTAKIAEQLTKLEPVDPLNTYQQDAELFFKKAEILKNKIHTHLWDDQQQIFLNYDLHQNTFIRRITYSSMVPLWAEIPTEAQAEAMIETYAINEAHLWTPYGMRTLSALDPAYNNDNIIKPFSNWQGPIWPIANYIYMNGLLNYGYTQKALELAKSITKIIIKDFETSGGMHENYHAQNGTPLAAPNFISWNLLVDSMVEEAKKAMDTNRIGFCQ